MGVLLALVRKELTLIARDWHALALLFLMPAFFILVMSLALRDVYDPDREGAFTYIAVDLDRSLQSAALLRAISAQPAFRRVSAEQVGDIAEELRRGRVHLSVEIPAGFGAALADTTPRRVMLSSGPTALAAATQPFTAVVRGALAELFVRSRIPPALQGMLGAPGATVVGLERLLEERTVTSEGMTAARPTSVQQSVPAWLVFAMFFIALPLSTTWIQERTQGTAVRLGSLGVRPSLLLAGKLLPYLAVNQLQVAAMLAVGVWIVPTFGGDALTLGSSIPALAVMALAVGIAAVSYALLIANLAATTEQATILTGASNILLGALGGVMVPRDVMPQELQGAAGLSPMAWGLEGFLDVFLRGGTVGTVLANAFALVVFGGAALAIASWRLSRVRIQ